MCTKGLKYVDTVFFTHQILSIPNISMLLCDDLFSSIMYIFTLIWLCIHIHIWLYFAILVDIYINI